MSDGVGQIESLLKNAKESTTFHFYFSKEVEAELMQGMAKARGFKAQLVPSIELSGAQLQGILDLVRTTVLEWALKLEEDGMLGEGLSFSTKEKERASSNTYNIKTFIGEMSNSQVYKRSPVRELTMRDSYSTGQAGAIGPNASAQDMTFDQVWKQIRGSVELPKLADELSRLRQAMKQEAVDPEQDIAVSEIAKAEQAAKSGDGPRALDHLKSAGKWALYSWQTPSPVSYPCDIARSLNPTETALYLCACMQSQEGDTGRYPAWDRHIERRQVSSPI